MSSNHRKLIALPRSHSKSIFQQVKDKQVAAHYLNKRDLSTQWPPYSFDAKPRFPKDSGFYSDSFLHYTVRLIREDIFITDPSDYIVFTAYASNLGQVNINYIIDNISMFRVIYEEAENDYGLLDKELITAKALKRLYTVNFYYKLSGLPYNLPAQYSRKMKQLEQDLIMYYKGDG